MPRVHVAEADMTRFLGNWEVESDIILPDGAPFLRFDHPSGRYTAFLRNISEDREGQSFLSMQFIFDAPSLTQARDAGELLAKEFLDYIVLASNLKLRLRRILQIYNWEPGGPAMRDCIYYSPSATHGGGPFEALQKPLLDSVAMLQGHEIDPRLRRALKWFGNGVAARAPDDQFSFFWFVVEIVAQQIKKSTPVPDRCPRCKGPLYCEECGSTPLHRPYPKQAVQQLFERYVPQGKGPDEFYKRASDARNMLMHGDEVKSIEQALGIEFSELVDQMGELAWVSLINQFIPALVGKQPVFIQTNRYVHMTMTGTAVMQVGFSPSFDNPDPAQFPKVQISMTSANRKSPNSPTPPTENHQQRSG